MSFANLKRASCATCLFSGTLLMACAVDSRSIPFASKNEASRNAWALSESEANALGKWLSDGEQTLLKELLSMLHSRSVTEVAWEAQLIQDLFIMAKFREAGGVDSNPALRFSDKVLIFSSGMPLLTPTMRERLAARLRFIHDVDSGKQASEKARQNLKTILKGLWSKKKGEVDPCIQLHPDDESWRKAVQTQAMLKGNAVDQFLRSSQTGGLTGTNTLALFCVLETRTRVVAMGLRDNKIRKMNDTHGGSPLLVTHDGGRGKSPQNPSPKATKVLSVLRGEGIDGKSYDPHEDVRLIADPDAPGGFQTVSPTTIVPNRGDALLLRERLQSIPAPAAGNTFEDRVRTYLPHRVAFLGLRDRATDSTEPGTSKETRPNPVAASEPIPLGANPATFNYVPYCALHARLTHLRRHKGGDATLSYMLRRAFDSSSLTGFYSGRSTGRAIMDAVVWDKRYLNNVEQYQSERSVPDKPWLDEWFPDGSPALEHVPAVPAHAWYVIERLSEGAVSTLGDLTVQ